ncbi:MAG TPA: hypothetical protein VK589_25505 [Chryseolinea sp.]|nr:hypothetical protein [Chryseolinea sp.]
MSKRKKNIEEFFSAYEALFNKSLSNEHVTNEEMSQFFEECFVESSPAGVICGKNDDQFLEKIQSGFDFYKSIGSKSMTIVSKDITLLDDLHALAKIYWQYSYVKDEREGTIDFTNYYFVTTRDQVKIFSYIAGDEQKALADKGLLAETEAG